MDVLFRLFNSLLMVVGPVGVGVFLVKRWRLSWRLFFMGAGTFIGSQVLHIPFNQFVLLPFMEDLDLIRDHGVIPLLVYGLILGLSAGVFEEGARYMVYRLWLPEVKRWKEAVLYGAGHGGVEAILLGGLALYAFFQATAYRNADLSGLFPSGQIELAKTQIEAYWSAPWYAAMMGSIERAFAIIIQISLAVMVFHAVNHRKILWLAVALGCHTIIDTVAVLGIRSWGVYLTEAAVAGFAMISLVAIFYLRTKNGEEIQGTEREPLPEPGSAPIIQKLDLSKERLDNSRYDDGL